MEELKKTYDKIYRYCFYKVRNSAAAEDITQETFLRYFAHDPKIKRGEDMAYLYTIAKNFCIDYFRKKRAETIFDDDPGGGCPAEEFYGSSDTKIAVRAALERLDERHKEIILLRYLSDLSVNETAETMGISRFAAYRLERAALAEMKKYLKGAL